MENIITITGDLGSGKSVLGKALATELGYTYLSTGIIQRTIAEKYNMSTLELNKYSENNREIDNEIDNNLRELNNNPSPFVVDSRLAWFFIPSSFKMYLLTNVEIAGQRIMKDNKRNVENYNTIEDAIEAINQRKHSENTRFLNYYNADCSNLKNFDVVIDASFASPPQVIKLSLSLFSEFKIKKNINKYWVSPKNLYPMQHIRSINRDNSKKVRESILKNGYDNSQTIDVAYYKNMFFIVDGHNRTSGALINEIPFVPIKIISDEKLDFNNGISVRQYLEDQYNKSSVYDWEDMHNFRFSKYYE